MGEGGNAARAKERPATVHTLIFQLTLSELAPCRQTPEDCWGFIGPVPLPLWMSVFFFNCDVI